MSQKPLSKKDQTQIAILVVTVIACAIGFGMFMANRQDSEFHNTPLAKQRIQHPTHLHQKGPAPQAASPLRPAPYQVEYVEYLSSAGKLGAWLLKPDRSALPPPERETPLPAVLWGHGGYAVGTEDATLTLPFVSS